MATSPYKSTNSYDADTELRAKEIIVALLAEYSAKLIDKTGRFENIRYRRSLWICICAFGIGGGLTYYALLKSPPPIILYVYMGALLVSTVLAILYLLEHQRSALLKEEIVILSMQLTRLLERASAIEDHSKLNFGEHFELDFRLKDAEIALRRAKKYIGVTSYRYITKRLEDQEQQYHNVP